MNEHRWWESAVIYQVYPRAFQDSDGDGIGDLAGIAHRLDYLAWLGLDAIWLSPVYPSPMRDYGYDVADYRDIDPVFGDLAAFDALLEAMHRRGLRLIMDFVPNHTSSDHPWFDASRRSRDDPQRDWYVWRDAAPDGGPPNNWQSSAGGSAWEFDPATAQYYYHAFLPSQPDLNWRNPQVRSAMYEVLDFWLERGVDGFRIDVLWHLMKDPEFRDDPVNDAWQPGDPPFRRVVPLYSADHVDVLEIVREMRARVERHGRDRLLIGELYLPLERLVRYYGEGEGGVHLPFNFQLISAPWEAAALADLIRAYEAALPPGAWGNWVLGNHDQPRIASRVGAAQARVAAVLLLTLRGTPTLYYGDELGIADVAIAAERLRDPFGQRMPGTGQGRDAQRTPMPWSGEAHAGFSAVEPWLPLCSDWPSINVAAQRREAGSMLDLVRTLLALRRREPALAVGAYNTIAAAGDVLAYTRCAGARRLLVALNLVGSTRNVALSAAESGGEILLNTALDRAREPVAGELMLRPDEGVIVLLAEADGEHALAASRP